MSRDPLRNPMPKFLKDMEEAGKAMQELNQVTEDLNNGDANTVWQNNEPAEADMVSGTVYVWLDSEGLLTFGGLDSETGTKVVTSTTVNAEEPGLIGGIVGGLI